MIRLLLDIQVTKEEIEEIVFQLDPNKAPRSDGIPTFFYQEYWGIVKHDIIDTVMAFFRSGIKKPLEQLKPQI